MNGSANLIVTSQQSRFHSATVDSAANLEVDVKDLSIAIGQREILVDARLLLKSGTRYGLVGKNGSGKSTLFQAINDRLIPGLPSTLKVHLVTQVDPGPSNSTQTTLQQVLEGHTERSTALDERDTLHQILESSDHVISQKLLNDLLYRRAEDDLEEKRRIAQRRSGARGKEAREEEIKAEATLAEAEKRLGEMTLGDEEWSMKATEMLAEVQLILDLLDADNTEAQALKILRGLGFTETMITGPYDALSGGWRSRSRLATALLVQVDLLMLDEPTNFMDLECVLWLEKYLLSTDCYQTLLITSHDQTFLDRLAEQTISLRGKGLDYFDGTPSAMMAVEAEARRNLEKQVSAMDKKREHIESSIQEGRRAAKANNDDNRMRMVKSRQKKLDDRWGLERSAKGTRFKLNRDLPGFHTTSRAEVTLETLDKEINIKLDGPPELRSKGSLVSLEDVDIGYGKKAILKGVNFVLQPGSKVAFVGANGQGKSTLAKAIMGEIPALRGSLNRHPTMKIGYFTQHAVEALSTLPLTTSLAHFRATFETPMNSITEVEARTFLGRFGLGPFANVPIEALSGGQKVRLALAMIMWNPPSLLILDEVTTHLDAPTIRALATALRHYEGAIILITHDRWFSSVVVEGKPISDLESNSSDNSGEDDSGPGITYIVDKGKVKVLERGMEQYEELVERRLKRKMKGEASAP